MAQSPVVPWARVGVESAAIVASILFAFTIDAGWQARRERVEEIDTLQSLLNEFESNRAIIDEAIDAHGRFISAAESLFGMSVGFVPLPEDLGEIRGLVRNAFTSYRSTNYGGGTLTAILSSGRLGVIRNPELRRRIAAWPSVLEEATEDEQEVLRFRGQVLFPFLIRRLPLLFSGDAERVPAEFRTEEGLAQFQDILGDDELEAVLLLSAGLRGGAQEALVLARDYLDDLIGLIEAEEGVG